MKIVLASTSAYRRMLLERLQLPFETDRPETDESPLAGEAPAATAERLALEKARAVAARWPDALIIGSDQVAHLGDEVFGKPVDGDDAASMLRRLSGRTHTVATALWLVSAGQEQHALSISEVSFDTLDDARIDRYVEGGEWRGKAGGYAIQGRAECFVRFLSGSHSNVVGLPLFETAQLLRGAGWLSP